jgi:drug/metabolite transporter (DMT)-like permease
LAELGVSETRHGDRHGTVSAVVLLVLACTFWASTNLFIKYLSFHCGRQTQNFLRYMFAALALWFFVLRVYPDQVRAHLRYWPRLVGMAAAAVMFQVLLVASLYHLEPGFVSLSQSSIVVFTALLAYLFLAQERPLIRTARYLVGALLALGCAIGLVLAAPGVAFGEITVWAVCAVSASAFWAVYTVLARGVMERGNAFVTFAYVATLSAVCFGVMTAIGDWHGFTTIIQPPPLTDSQAWIDLADPVSGFWLPVAAAAFSGVLCIAVAHSFYFVAVGRVGAAVSGTMILAQPPLTVLLSYWVYGETITLWQGMFGVGILAGAYITLQARVRAAR